MYTAVLVGYDRQVLLSNMEFSLKFRNGLCPAGIYAAEIDGDTQFIWFGDDQAFDLAVRAGVAQSGKAERQYLANFSVGKLRKRNPNSLNLFCDSKKRPREIEPRRMIRKSLVGRRGVQAQIGIDPANPVPENNFLQLPRYEL